MPASLDAWIDAHPYLEPLARFQREVEAAVAEAPVVAAPAPHLEVFSEPFGRGVPLLRSDVAGVDAARVAAPVLAHLVARVAEADAPGALAAGARALHAALQGTPSDAARVLAWAIAGGDPATAPAQAGLARYLSWTALRPVIAPALAAYQDWRDDDAWGRPQCPGCGALPVQAQLVEEGAGRARLLACGCCGTRWRWKRLACPFCATEVQDDLEVLEPEGEPRLRIDACRACGGYVKTYAGEGEEAVFLADWPTLHLDVLAKDRGLARKGASLYDL